MNLSSARTISFKDGETLVDAHVRYRHEQWEIILGGQSTAARGKKLDGDRLAVELDDRRLIASVVAVDDKRSVFLQGSTYTLLRDDPLHRVDAGDSHGGGLTAPMPGKVVALLAQPGQQVEIGTPLLILEAMKMEHTITAPAAGTVKSYCYAAGEQVADGAALVEFEGVT
jgi:3-methylcrotonyl-CoA carboxylase alpha subunit